MRETDYASLYKKFNSFSIKKIKDLLQDMQEEMDQVGTRVTADGFKMVNESTNNLKYAVLIQINEEKSSKK